MSRHASRINILSISEASSVVRGTCVSWASEITSKIENYCWAGEASRINKAKWISEASWASFKGDASEASWVSERSWASWASKYKR